jgi:hypothetical protein
VADGKWHLAGGGTGNHDVGRSKSSNWGEPYLEMLTL